MNADTILLGTAVILIGIGVWLDIHHADSNNYKWSEWRIWPMSMWFMLVGIIGFFISVYVKSL